MMEYMTLIEERRSVRVYTDAPVDSDTLERILHAANRAPSAGDLQAYSIVVARTPAIRQALAKAAVEQQFVAQAPVVLVFLAEPERSGEKYGHRGETLYALQDATIACAYAQLAAHDLGLSACWVGAFRRRDVQEAIGTRENQMPVALLPIGHAAEKPQATPRRSLADLTREV
ncbi:MAG: nitroreductase family protein [Dehalococcoidia bacterium]